MVDALVVLYDSTLEYNRIIPPFVEIMQFVVVVFWNFVRIMHSFSAFIWFLKGSFKFKKWGEASYSKFKLEWVVSSQMHCLSCVHHVNVTNSTNMLIGLFGTKLSKRNLSLQLQVRSTWRWRTLTLQLISLITR